MSPNPWNGKLSIWEIARTHPHFTVSPCLPAPGRGMTPFYEGETQLTVGSNLPQERDFFTFQWIILWPPSLMQRPEQQPDLRDSSWRLPGTALPKFPVSGPRAKLSMWACKNNSVVIPASKASLCCDFPACCMEIRSPTCPRGCLTASMPCNSCKQNTHIHTHTADTLQTYTEFQAPFTPTQ